MREVRNVYEILIKRYKIHGRRRCILDVNIKMYLKENGILRRRLDSSSSGQDQLRGLLSIVMMLRERSILPPVRLHCLIKMGVVPCGYLTINITKKMRLFDPALN
jgi:hypothetical protein